MLITRHVLAETQSRRPSPKVAANTGYRILLAEDNIVNQKVAIALLERLGCRVDVAADGKEAVEMNGSFPYDLILMDCEMPERDGYKATAEIRRQETDGRHRTVVAITANALPGDLEKCLAAGMDDYIAKPVNPHQLEAMLQKWLLAPPHVKTAIEPTAAPIPAANTTAKISAVATLDYGKLAQLRELGTDDEFLHPLIDAFLEQMTQSVNGLRAQAAGSNWEALKKSAHRLKGSSANVGAQRLAAACQAIESLSESLNPRGTTAIVEDLVLESDRVRCELEILRNGSTALQIERVTALA